MEVHEKSETVQKLIIETRYQGKRRTELELPTIYIGKWNQRAEKQLKIKKKKSKTHVTVKIAQSSEYSSRKKNV